MNQSWGVWAVHTHVGMGGYRGFAQERVKSTAVPNSDDDFCAPQISCLAILICCPSEAKFIRI